MSYTSTSTYSVADVEVVMRRVTADLIMIASSTSAITEASAADYGHDIEVLAKGGYLKKVDVTLLSDDVERMATSFEVNTASGDLTMSRPGGVLWPKVLNPELRIVLSYTNAYDTTAREKTRPKLKLNWGPTTVDLSHPTLTPNASRDYVSNGYGMQRKDFNR